MKRSKEQALQTREAILEAGRKVFQRDGYSAATLEKIAQQAGVTRGAIYGHFKNKKEIANSIYPTDEEACIARRIQQHLRESKPIEEACIIATTEILSQELLREQLIVSTIHSEIQTCHNEMAFDAIEPTKINTLLQAAFNEAPNILRLKEDISPSLAAELVSNQMSGLIFCWLLSTTKSDMRKHTKNAKETLGAIFSCILK